MTEEFAVLGKRYPRKDAAEKVTGAARYIPDIQLPGMLHAKFLRSPHAHARIVSIDTSQAEKLPGVKCVLTHRNVPKAHPHRKFELLLDQTVHRPGEEVAAVAAVTEEIAEEALQLIKVEYEVLPSIIDFEAAMQPGATLAQPEYGSSLFRGTKLVPVPRIDEDGWLRLEVGDVEKGLAEAEVTHEGTYDSPQQYNCSPMPRSAICEWMGDKLTCYADTQLPLYLTRDLANSLGMPQSNIRVIANYAVGGYGGKSPEKNATLAAILAKRTGRAVKMVFSRAEDVIGTHRRMNYKNSYRIGVKKDGTITALHSRMITNWGSDTAVAYIGQSISLLGASSVLYQSQNCKAETCGVLTNMLGYGPMNGFGDPEAIYGIERLIDETAEKIDMDPVEFRFMNCARYGTRAMENHKVVTGPLEWGILGQDMDSLPELIRKCADAAGWKDKWKGWQTPMSVDGYKRRGIGIAIGLHHSEFWPSSAIVKMNQDGTANVLSGAVEIGQGYATAISQVVAEALGIRYEDVNPILADTNVTPAAIGNVASTGVSSPINAARIAAEDARRQMLEFASQRMQVPVENLEARGGMITEKGTTNSIPIADICFTNWQITGTGNNPPVESIIDKKTGKVIYAYSSAVSITEVEVDIETGRIELCRIVAGHDTGRTVNPTIVENQIDLGLTMSSGWVRSEEFIVDARNGVIMNPNLLDYKVPTFLDMPKKDAVRKIILEKPSAWGPFGAKGMSETPTTAIAPAMANAIYNATGVRIHSGSLTPATFLREKERMEGN